MTGVLIGGGGVEGLSGVVAAGTLGWLSRAGGTCPCLDAIFSSLAGGVAACLEATEPIGHLSLPPA